MAGTKRVTRTSSGRTERGTGGASGGGRDASLTERRKAATRMEIARAAAGLFVANGLRATRAEDIARAAGVAPRTFYRYFATKEQALAPLFAAGAHQWAEAVRDAPAHLTVAEALHHAAVHTLTPGVGVSATSLEWVRTLLRLTATHPALTKVWAEICQASERELAEVLAHRLAALTATSGESGESGDSAWGASTSAGPAASTSAGSAASGVAASAGSGVAASGVAASAGTGQGSSAGAEDTSGGAGAAAAAPGPGPRFAAAIAGAAVRVAVESWASGDEPAAGPKGPAGLAVRNLEALRDFAWETC